MISTRPSPQTQERDIVGRIAMLTTRLASTRLLSPLQEPIQELIERHVRDCFATVATNVNGDARVARLNSSSHPCVLPLSGS